MSQWYEILWYGETDIDSNSAPLRISANRFTKDARCYSSTVDVGLEGSTKRVAKTIADVTYAENVYNNTSS